MKTEREEARPSSVKVTVLAIAIGSVLVLIGSSIGALWLASLWGIRIHHGASLFVVHPDLQVFGFLTLFIMGVAYTLIPRFKNKTLERSGLAYLSIALVLAGNVALILRALDAGGPMHPAVGSTLILAGAIIFTTLMLRILGKPSGPLAIAEPYMSLGVAALALSLIGKVFSEASLLATKYAYADPGFLQLVLLGFPSMMIFGVMVRTVHFRFATLRRTLVKVAFPLAAAGILLSFLGFLKPELRGFTTSSSLSFLIAGILFVRSIDALKRVTSGSLFIRMSEGDRNRYLYFSAAVTVAAVWLLIGLTLGLIFTAFLELGFRDVFGLRDSFIHAIAVGFIGSTIMAYGPIILPPILSGRVPYKGLGLMPLYLVTLGNAWRIVGVVLQGSFGASFWPTALSGGLILVGMIHFLWMTHSLRN